MQSQEIPTTGDTQTTTTSQTTHAGQKHEIKRVEQTTCCIVGGGPAGAIMALLLARQGIPVVLLEAHMDFDRNFAAIPSTLRRWRFWMKSVLLIVSCNCHI